MLLQFRVSNFKSFKDEQELSLIANNSDKELPQNLISQEIPGIKVTRALRGAALYGPNASGKSNLIEAIWNLRHMVTKSASSYQPDQRLPTVPFKLQTDFQEKPTEMEIIFVHHGCRYVYFVSYNQKQIFEEFLSAFPSGREQVWIDRSYNQKTKKTTWGKVSGEFESDKSLEEKTRNNSLLLSVGAQFNHKQLTKVYEWFSDKLKIINLGVGSGLSQSITSNMILDTHISKDVVLNMMKSADFRICDISVEEKEIPEKEIPTEIVQQIRDQDPDHKFLYDKISFFHEDDSNEKIAFDFEKDESTGTKRFFSLLGPLIDTIENDYVMLIDEIENSLHPLLVKELVRYIMQCHKEKCNSQLVFVTHNPILLDRELMRRDQIWFNEKDRLGATHLYPLTDYKPRKSESLAKGYLSGRYGALPFIPEGLHS